MRRPGLGEQAEQVEEASRKYLESMKGSGNEWWATSMTRCCLRGEGLA
jgi:hypothetical protein